MKSSHSHDRKLHPISEYALILGAGAGAVASIAAQQLAAASIPVTTLVALGMLNRYRLDPRIKEGETAGPTLDEAKAESQAATSHGISSQPRPEAGTPDLWPRNVPSRPSQPVATLSAARFSRHRDPQDHLEDQQRASLKKLGEQLKQIREEKGLALEEIYQQTFIQVYKSWSPSTRIT
jgi:hypothetical protein